MKMVKRDVALLVTAGMCGHFRAAACTQPGGLAVERFDERSCENVREEKYYSGYASSTGSH